MQSSQHQHIVADEPSEDGVYPGLEALQAALCGAAGCCAGPALPGSAILLSALRAQTQALQQCWVESPHCSWHTRSLYSMYYFLYTLYSAHKTSAIKWFNRGFISFAMNINLFLSIWIISHVLFPVLLIPCWLGHLQLCVDLPENNRSQMDDV